MSCPTWVLGTELGSSGSQLFNSLAIILRSKTVWVSSQTSGKTPWLLRRDILHSAIGCFHVFKDSGNCGGHLATLTAVHQKIIIKKDKIGIKRNPGLLWCCWTRTLTSYDISFHELWQTLPHPFWGRFPEFGSSKWSNIVIYKMNEHWRITFKRLFL